MSFAEPVLSEMQDSEEEDLGAANDDAAIEDAAELSQSEVLLARDPSSREANFFDMQVLILRSKTAEGRPT